MLFLPFRPLSARIPEKRAWERETLKILILEFLCPHHAAGSIRKFLTTLHLVSAGNVWRHAWLLCGAPVPRPREVAVLFFMGSRISIRILEPYAGEESRFTIVRGGRLLHVQPLRSVKTGSEIFSMISFLRQEFNFRSGSGARSRKSIPCSGTSFPHDRQGIRYYCSCDADPEF